MTFINLSNELIHIEKSYLKGIIKKIKELLTFMKKDFQKNPNPKDLPDVMRIGYYELAKKYIKDLEELESRINNEQKN